MRYITTIYISKSRIIGGAWSSSESMLLKSLKVCNKSKLKHNENIKMLHIRLSRVTIKSQNGKYLNQKFYTVTC